MARSSTQRWRVPLPLAEKPAIVAPTPVGCWAEHRWGRARRAWRGPHCELRCTLMRLPLQPKQAPGDIAVTHREAPGIAMSEGRAVAWWIGVKPSAGIAFLALQWPVAGF